VQDLIKECFINFFFYKNILFTFYRIRVLKCFFKL